MKSLPGHLLDRVQTVLVVALTFLSLGACKNDPGSRATQVAEGKDFWPEAPTPTIKTGTRTFRYKPENIGRYKLVVDGGSTEESMPMKIKMLLELDFRAGATASERNAHIETLDMWMNAGPERAAMRINSQEFYFEQGTNKTQINRGDTGALNVAELTERPFAVLTFDATANKVSSRANPEHPLATADGGAVDMLDSGLVLFPDLPQEPIAPGHRWTMTRNTKLGATGPRAEVTYDFVYVGDGRCPTGAGTCSLLAFRAAPPGVGATRGDGATTRVLYGFAGKVFFNQDRGSIDESRVRLELDVSANGETIPLAVTYKLEPRNSSRD